MQYSRFGAQHRTLTFALIVLAVVAILPASLRAQAVGKSHSPTWSKDLEGWAQRSSVAFGNVDGDADQEIFVGTNAGKVYGFNQDGSPLPGWPVNVLGRVGSAAAIGDITGDAQAEIVITAGWGPNDTPDASTGGIWAFSASGQLLWRKVTMTTSSTGKPAGVFASPVLVDLNGDGTLDVLTASYDQNVYAIKGDGSSVFPGALPAKAGNRNDALIWLGDGSWATPAVGDVDGDGVVDIVVTSATNIDARFSYIYPGWSDQNVANACSKVPQDLNAINRSQKRACGMVAVFSNSGQLKPGWPQFIPGHTYDASPALANLDADPQLEIVTGNGWDPGFGDASQPFYLTAWNHDGSIFKRFNIDAVIFESGPAIGDITGDGKPEIVVGTNPFTGVNRANTNKIFAFDSNLNLLPGFPVEARDAQFNQQASPGVLSLADINDDGAADIVFGTTWDVRAINGSGQYLNSNLSLHGTGPFSGQPAIGNIDSDSRLELVFAAARGTSPGVIHKFDLNVSATSGELPWAQFRGNQYHTGLFAPPDLRVSASLGAITAGQDRRFALPIGDTVGGTLTWSATASDSWIKLDPSSGKAGTNALGVTLDGGAPFSDGVATGTITITSGSIVKNVEVRLIKVDQIRATVYLPLTR
jgi:hypothetical protein